MFLENFLALLARIAIGVIRALPLKFCFLLGQVLGLLAWLILPKYRRLARKNIHLAFPEMSKSEVSALVRTHFTRLGANILSAFKVAAMSPVAIEHILQVEGGEHVANAAAAGRGVVGAINHMGNWELCAQVVKMVPDMPLGTIYQPLRSKKINDLIVADRERLGTKTFDRKKGFAAACAFIKTPGAMGVLVDQNAGASGLYTLFFGHLCSTSTLAATLAQRTGAVVVPVAVLTVGWAKWRLVISPPLPDNDGDINRMTLDINRALEQQIRTSPADWFWVHNRWKFHFPHPLLAKAKRGIYIPEGEKPAPFRILLRSPNWLGDAVMATHTIRAFKYGRPDAHITILAPSKLLPVWRRLPEVDEVISSDGSVFQVARRLREAQPFRVAVLFPNSLRSALEVWLGNVPHRFGFEGHRRKKLLTKAFREPTDTRPLHQTERYFRLAHECGGIHPPAPAKLCKPSNETTIVVCPGAEYGPAKCWPAKSFVETMEIVSQNRPCRWLLVGTAKDRTITEQIAKQFSGTVENLAGKTSLDELADTLISASALLTNDTGTMHLADMLGTPLVAIFGSTEPRLTGPIAPTSRVLRYQVECSPCFLRKCPRDFRCMAAVPPSLAANTLLEMLKTEG